MKSNSKTRLSGQFGVQVVAALGLLLIGTALVGQGRRDVRPRIADQESREGMPERDRLQGVAANSAYIFRVYESGRVEFLQLGNPVTSGGVPGWTELRIDHERKSTHVPPYRG